jgi:hypothetical protein
MSLLKERSSYVPSYFKKIRVICHTLDATPEALPFIFIRAWKGGQARLARKSFFQDPVLACTRAAARETPVPPLQKTVAGQTT